MKSILISIKPKWCEKIAAEEKTIEVRKNAPKPPFKVYIYCTKEKKQDDIIWAGAFGDRGKWNRHIIGEFICDKVVRTCGWRLRGDTQQCAKRTVAEIELPKLACLSIDEIVDYAGSENREVVGWHISDLKIYDRPRELSEFFKPCPTKEKGDCLSCDCLADNDYGGVCTNNLTRPPQSYMFVEEIETSKEKQ